MNDRGLDRLFKKRLDGYQQKPSDAVWSKLDAKLTSRKDKVWWQFARVAAVLLLIACSIYVFNRWNGDKGLEEAIVETTTNDQDQPASSVDPQDSKSLIAENQEENSKETSEDTAENNNREPERESQQLNPANSSAKSSSGQKSAPKTPTQVELMEVSQTKVLAEKAPTTEKKRNSTTQAPADNATVAMKSNEPIQETDTKVSTSGTKITITYKKSPAPPEPTLALIDEPVEKGRGVKKLWLKAQTLKNTDLSLARLRTAKNQMLVFNKKNKDKELKSN